MTPHFAVKTSPHFERLYKRLVKQHPRIPKLLGEVIAILETDPFNRSQRYVIKKLSGSHKTVNTDRVLAGGVFVTILLPKLSN
jgi:mRNA-degrading endonuclease YafQ of YafQ-DinJ toxin-antitoxin module